jgi:hypothetical protein
LHGFCVIVSCSSVHKSTLEEKSMRVDPCKRHGGTQRKVKMACVFRGKIAMPGDHTEAYVEA